MTRVKRSRKELDTVRSNAVDSICQGLAWQGKEGGPIECDDLFMWSSCMSIHKKADKGRDERHRHLDEEHSYVNLRWRTFPDQVVQKLNPGWHASDDASCSGCGCGCGS